MIESDGSLSYSSKKDSPGLLSELYKYGFCYTRSRVGPPRDDSAPKFEIIPGSGIRDDNFYLPQVDYVSHYLIFHHVTSFELFISTHLQAHVGYEHCGSKSFLLFSTSVLVRDCSSRANACAAAQCLVSKSAARPSKNFTFVS